MTEDADDNRRRSRREAIQDTLFIRTVSADQITLEEMKTVNAINASAYGMQVAMDFEVLVASELALWITAGSSRMMVTGTVRWTRPNGEGSWLVGIQIDDEAAPTMQQWLASRQDP